MKNVGKVDCFFGRQVLDLSQNNPIHTVRFDRFQYPFKSPDTDRGQIDWRIERCVTLPFHGKIFQLPDLKVSLDGLADVS